MEKHTPDLITGPTCMTPTCKTRNWVCICVTALTSAIGVHHESLVDVVLDEEQCLFEDLPCASLLHGVGVPGVTEQGQQLTWGTGLTEGGRKRERERK